MIPTIQDLKKAERELTKLAHHPKFISKQEILLNAVNTLGFCRLYLLQIEKDREAKASFGKADF
jgi:hypothetical protein